MKDALAIVGSHPRTRNNFDFTRTDCDVWIFNEAISWAPRADAVFQMHDKVIWSNPRNRNDPKHYKWLTNGETPVIFMQKQYPEVPKSEKYPLDKILHLTNLSSKFLTSSIAFAMALAVQREYKTIEIYGVAMETDTEYKYQRDGVAYWLGVADGKGIDVRFMETTFDGILYGYGGEVVLKRDDFIGRIAELTADDTEFKKATDLARGAFDVFMQTGGEEAARRFAPFLQAQVKAGQTYSKVDGARQENQRYIERADAMIRTSGVAMFSRQEFEAGAATAQKRSAEIADAAIRAGGRADVMFSALAKTTALKNRKRRVSEFLAALNDYITKALSSALFEGVYDENIRWLGVLDKHIRAAGGAKSEAVMLEALNV